MGCLLLRTAWVSPAGSLRWRGLSVVQSCSHRGDDSRRGRWREGFLSQHRATGGSGAQAIPSRDLDLEERFVKCFDSCPDTVTLTYCRTARSQNFRRTLLLVQRQRRRRYPRNVHEVLKTWNHPVTGSLCDITVGPASDRPDARVSASTGL